jgi:large subunit ribosomal protein L20
MRVKRGVAAHARHNKIKRATKGMQHARRASSRMGRQAIVKSLQYAYRDRRNKKRTLRATWNMRINAAARELGVSYSVLIHGLKTHNIELDRKVLADMAVNEPAAFKAVVEAATQA